MIMRNYLCHLNGREETLSEKENPNFRTYGELKSLKSSTIEDNVQERVVSLRKSTPTKLHEKLVNLFKDSSKLPSKRIQDNFIHL